MLSRRHILAGAIAAPALLKASRGQAAQTLKISHQFPGGTIDEGDFRDRLCRKFAQEISKRTNGALVGEVYPNASLMKTNAQFSALRKGALDMSLYPMPYAGGELQELNIGLMPCLVSSYSQGTAWKNAEVGRELTKLLGEKGIVMVSWIWQAGGCVSRAQKLVGPEDAKGQKVRGGSREMDMMFKQAGASVISMPSNEVYAAMQTGAADAAVTSSTSLISFRLEELSKHLTAGKGKSYWFMCEPLMMSKAVFDALPKDQQNAVMEVGASLEAFGTEAAKADDETVIKVYKTKGAEVHDLDDAVIAKWRDLARESAWKDYSAKSETNARLMKLAVEVAEKTA
ncbi:MAG: TRAP-type transport system periplasmic protein [Methylobacteriaceae bacterium]|jgi:TRAP-type C4-dicarboxylate transport system substrate-binding protein|nr:TRAP-type transport system periplasmic protein [Methylobacteriaceae bacterium]